MPIESQPLRVLLSRLDAHVHPDDRALVFGSTARGDRHEQSDLDVMVITSRPVNPQTETRRIYQALGPTRPFVDLMVVEQNHFEKWRTVRRTVFFDAIKEGFPLERSVSVSS